MSYLFLFVGMVNYYLLTISRNITFFDVFIMCAINGFALLFSETKIGKIALLLSVPLYIIFSAISLYYHHLYGGVINDYLIIMAEAVILSMLTANSILPIKIAKTSRNKKTRGF